MARVDVLNAHRAKEWVIPERVTIPCTVLQTRQSMHLNLKTRVSKFYDEEYK